MIKHKHFHTNRPRLIEHQILEYISTDYMIEIQSSNDEYMRLKTTPALPDTLINDIEHIFRVKTKKYTSEDSCILEITNPVFDIIIIRDTSNFPKPNGWILEVVKNLPYSKMEVIATLRYDEDHPYNLQVAEDLVSYLNIKSSQLLEIEYEELYTI